MIVDRSACQSHEELLFTSCSAEVRDLNTLHPLGSMLGLSIAHYAFLRLRRIYCTQTLPLQS